MKELPRLELELERLEAIREKASDAFWDTVAGECPEIRTGDFGPSETMRWDVACTDAIASWYEGNAPLVTRQPNALRIGMLVTPVPDANKTIIGVGAKGWTHGWVARVVQLSGGTEGRIVCEPEDGWEPFPHLRTFTTTYGKLVEVVA